MRWNIDDVPIFVAAVEQNGITAAARWLDMPKSTVSKSLNRLEQALGVRLLERNTRNVRVTSEGETFFRKCQQILDEVRDADATMAGLQSVPSGTLTVALPPAFCQEIVAPNLDKFQRTNPQIDLELIVTSHAIDLLRDQVDIAVVVGSQENSELVSRTLLAAKLICVTSPEFAQSGALGHSAKDLVSNIRVCERRYATRRFRVKVHGRDATLDLSRKNASVNDPISVRTAVIRGAGVALLPEQYCKDQLARGELVEVYKHIHLDEAASKLSVVYPSRRQVAGKTRAFLEFLEGIC